MMYEDGQGEINNILITEELVHRAARTPALGAENTALRVLARQLAESPHTMLKQLVAIAKDLCDAGTAGVSLLDVTSSGEQSLRWAALAGALEPYEGQITPIASSPCGVCLERRAPQLYSYPERYSTYLQQLKPTIVEALVIPLFTGDQPVGTLWIASHDQQRHFDAEDLRQMTSLADFAVAAQGFLTLVSNITKHEQAGEAQRQSEVQFRTLASHAPVGIFMSDVEGNCLYVNERWCTMAGMSPKTAQGQGWVTALHPDDRERVADAWYRAAQSGQVFAALYRFQTPRGKITWLQGSAAGLQRDTGEIIGYLGTLTDITERKQTEAALIAQEQRYRYIFEAVSVSIWEEDFSPVKAAIDQLKAAGVQDFRQYFAEHPEFVQQATGMVRLRDTNQASLQMFGAQDKAELLSSLHHIFVPETQEAFIAELLAIATEAPFLATETVLQTLQGNRLNVWITITFPSPSEPYDRVLVSLLDISARKQAEAALQESEERLRLALSAANQGLYDLNVQTGDAIVSPEYAQMLGYDPAEFQETNAKWRDRLHPDDVAAVSQTYEDYISGRRDGYRLEFRQRTASGEWKWILSIGKIVAWQSDRQPLRMLGTHTDITERKQAEAVLRDREQRLNLATTAAELGVYEWHAQTDHAVWENQRMYDIFGHALEDGPLSNEELTQNVIHPDDRELLEQRVSEGMRPGNLFHAVYRIRRRNDGQWRWVETRGRFTFAPDETPLSLIGVLSDITEAKRVEEERKQAEQEREHWLERERMAREEAETANRVKDEFLAVLSHELRSPLNPILGWSKLLQTRKLDATKTKEALKVIERNAKLQSELIEDLLDVSRILQGKLSLNVDRVDLIATIQAAMETVQLSAEAKSIQIQTALEPGIGPVLGDAARLQQVVWNLLSNATKFTPAGGRIEIRLQRLGTYAQLTVSDTGKGIATDFLPYVFDYFRQADSTTTRKFGGLGLGLAIVRHLAELHGGTITAASPGEGEGATFTVKLPLMQPHAAAQESSVTIRQSLELNGTKVLVVDDDTDTREFVVFLLEQSGADVTALASASEALAVLPQLKPNVLLSDIGMPEMDGYMLLRQVRMLSPEMGGQTPAIAFTAYAGEIDHQQALAVGFQRHISKPVAPDALIEAIVNLVKHS